MKLRNKRIISLILAFVMLFSMVPMTALASGSGEIKENLWNGRSAVFVGDSITEGIGTTKIYYQFLSETLGFSSVNAMGVAGSCISAASDYGQGNQPLINRYQKIPSTDLIVIYMGTNDYGHETPLGSVEDTQDVSFYGALNTIIPALVAKHSSSKIVFVTPIHRYGFGTSKILGTQFTADSLPNGVGATLGDYVEALITVCANNGVSVIDLYTEWTLNPADSEVQSNYMPDGLHPNAAGHELIAEIMEPHIRSYAPVEKAPAVENEPEEKTELIYGNKFVSSFSQENRASSRVNQYLKAGTVITLKNPDIFQWACTKTTDENSCDNLGYFPNGSWSDQKTAVVANDGWIGFVFKYRDETRSFDLTKPLSDYITIEAPHAHTYEATVSVPTCTEQGYTTYTCECGDSYVADYVDANGHSYKGITCTVCDETHPSAENYEGKVISILGDSISTFEGYIPKADGFNLEHLARYPQDNLLKDVNETWWMQVITCLDAKLGINDSWRGATVSGAAPVTTGTTGENASMANLTRIQNLGSNGTPDIILFYGGTNDLAHVSKVGSFDSSTAPTTVDLTTKKWDNLADGYVNTLLRLQYFYPDAQIVCLLPTYTTSYYSNNKLAQGNEVLADICEHYGVSYVDLRECGIDISDLPDGIHPGEVGMDYISNTVIECMLAQCKVENEKNIVYTVAHKLENAESSLSYYKGISEGKPFIETITGNELNVTVTMDGVDITSSVYEDGKITINAVTGNLVITASAKKKPPHVDYLQQLPKELCAGMNLWKVLEHDKEYYTVNGWGVHSSGKVYSVTIPVKDGDYIYATSFNKIGQNGGTVNGVRVTWFAENDILESVSADNVYTEFSKNGYLSAPKGAVAVNVPMWNNGSDNELYILNRDHSFQNGICAACGEAQPGPVITQQPVNGEAKLGERYMVEVKAEGKGLKYQWYFRNAGTEKWYKSSVKDNTYDDIMTKARAGRDVYCVITDANGNSVTTEVAKLIAIPSEKLEIITQPVDGGAVLGEKYCVNVEAKGDSLKYQWYFRNANTEKWYKSSVKDNTYDDIMTKARAGREIYCVITDAVGNSVTTDIVELVRIPVKLEITSQPADATAHFGETFCATVEAKGDGLKYQWYYRNAGSDTWHKSGVRDNTYDDVMTKARNGREIYCVITDQWGNSITTDTAKLIAVPSVELKVLSQSYESAALGERYCATVETQGEGLTFQWYFRNEGTKQWYKSSVRDNTYDDVMTKARANRDVYCIITDAFGNQVTTEVMTIYLEK